MALIYLLSFLEMIESADNVFFSYKPTIFKKRCKCFRFNRELKIYFYQLHRPKIIPSTAKKFVTLIDMFVITRYDIIHNYTCYHEEAKLTAVIGLISWRNAIFVKGASYQKKSSSCQISLIQVMNWAYPGDFLPPEEKHTFEAWISQWLHFLSRRFSKDSVPLLAVPECVFKKSLKIFLTLYNVKEGLL